MAYSFPIARKLLAFAGRARRNWLDRHQNPFNFWIHLLGIPLARRGRAAAVPRAVVLGRRGDRRRATCSSGSGTGSRGTTSASSSR